MTIFFNKFEKPRFWTFLVHFPNFWGKSSSVTRNFLRVTGTTPKFKKKLMILFHENARTEGRKDGTTLFHRTITATVGSPINCCSSSIKGKKVKTQENDQCYHRHLSNILMIPLLCLIRTIFTVNFTFMIELSKYKLN